MATDQTSDVCVVVPVDVDVEELTNIQNRMTGEIEEINRTKPYTFYLHFLCRRVLSDMEHFGSVENGNLYIGMELRGLFKDKKAGDKVRVKIEAFKKLKEAVLKPTNKYPPYIFYQCIEYIRCIEFAQPWKEEEAPQLPAGSVDGKGKTLES